VLCPLVDLGEKILGAWGLVGCRCIIGGVKAGVYFGCCEGLCRS
jgi:hypothetical protein